MRILSLQFFIEIKSNMLGSCEDRSRIIAAPILILCPGQGGDSNNDAVMQRSSMY